MDGFVPSYEMGTCLLGQSIPITPDKDLDYIEMHQSMCHPSKQTKGLLPTHKLNDFIEATL